ncbi:MAG: hypothetical protein HZA46_05900 [Planctomycetales bacterium]|nr:hypothetical protein [Planctomycetales bacterium]
MKWLRVSIFGFLVLCAVAAIACLYVVVPNLKLNWVGYDVELPEWLVWVVWMSDITVKYPHAVLPMALGGCVSVGYALGLVGSSNRRAA